MALEQLEALIGFLHRAYFCLSALHVSLHSSCSASVSQAVKVSLTKINKCPRFSASTKTAHLKSKVSLI